MSIDNLPTTIPVFPLSGVVFFPKTVLPLNIFEKRYIQMIDDCMKGGKLFGMVHPKLKTNLASEVYNVGCLGKIINFNETRDKRFIINLSGIIRFKIEKELKTEKLYREFNVNYSDFIYDLNSEKKELDVKNLIRKIKSLFKKKNYLVEFDKLEKLSFDQLVNAICMIFPFSIEEKQKILETNKLEDQVEVLEKIINFSLLNTLDNETIQ